MEQAIDSWRPHDHDTEPDEYPFTLAIIRVAEQVDNARRMHRKGVIDDSELLVDVFRFQQEITGMFSRVVRDHLIEAVAKHEKETQ